jgi:hypothetical protein
MYFFTVAAAGSNNSSSSQQQEKKGFPFLINTDYKLHQQNYLTTTNY